MSIISKVIEYIFSIALFINALLFIPQIIRIVKERSVEGISLTTFLGLLLIQFAVVLHGVVVRDYILIYGYILSMLTCGSVVVLVLTNRQSKILVDINDVSLKEVIKQLPEYIYWKDINGSLVWNNFNDERDCNASALIDNKGKFDYVLFSKECTDNLTTIDKNVINTGKLKIIEEEVIKPDNSKAFYLSR